MTAAAPRTFPVPRTYQTWLRDLTPVHPRRLWFSHLLVHRIEALVTVARSYQLESLSQALLRRLFTSSAVTARVASLEDLHFDRQFAVPLLREFAAVGLLRAADDGWTLTDAGQQALQNGGYTRRAEERRVFYFVDNPGATPQYVPLTQTAGPVADIGDSWQFAPAVLHECLQRLPQWKQHVGFPVEVEAVVVEPRDAWRQVILDRAEHAPLLFVQLGGGDGDSSLIGYLVRCDNWTLQREPPALMLGGGWQEVLPDFADGLSLEAWREAWLAWCQSRQLPAPEALACQVEYADCKIHVKAMKVFVERLKATRNEVLRGETWLTLGTGRTRAAACVEIREQES
jgi:hypothetical protein